jgi:hypothetical protein
VARSRAATVTAFAAYLIASALPEHVAVIPFSAHIITIIAVRERL